MVRGWFFDRAVRRFIGKHANAVVVNVGCGLSTRFQRIGDGKAVFYDMDLPEVIALRRELIPEQPGNPLYRGLPAGNRLAGRPAPSAFRCAFYFRGRRRADVFLRKAGKGIPASCSGAFRGRRTVVRCLRHNNEPSRVKPDSLRGHEAQIRSGLSDGRLVEQWEPRLRLLEQANYMKFFRPRWGFFFGQILGRMTRLCYKFSSMLGYEIVSK